MGGGAILRLTTLDKLRIRALRLRGMKVAYDHVDSPRYRVAGAVVAMGVSSAISSCDLRE